MEINKDFRFKSGIYYIKCLSNSRVYVGSSKDIYNRLHQHRHKLNKNKHFKVVQNSYNKYGDDNFECGILEECPVDKLIEREQYYVDTLNPYFNTNKHIEKSYVREYTEEDKKVIQNIVKTAFYSKNHFYYHVQSQKKEVEVYDENSVLIRTFESRAECIRYYSNTEGLSDKIIRNAIKKGIPRQGLYFKYKNP